ncbi:hypothetical protein ACIGO7_31265 [Streptomyces virginiae]|uniref:hypothetical protein n=1 Tax=Streptomyces virginiae TaxID=1961 RepID=UPI0037D963AF
MPSLGPRTLLATIALTTTLTLTACDPAAEAEAPPAPPAPPAPSAASATASAPASSTSPAGSGKHTLAEAATAGGLTKATGAGAVSDVPVDPGEMRDGMHLVVADYNRAEIAAVSSGRSRPRPRPPTATATSVGPVTRSALGAGNGPR